MRASLGGPAVAATLRHANTGYEMNTGALGERGQKNLLQLENKRLDHLLHT